MHRFASSTRDSEVILMRAEQSGSDRLEASSFPTLFRGEEDSGSVTHREFNEAANHPRDQYL